MEVKLQVILYFGRECRMRHFFRIRSDNNSRDGSGYPKLGYSNPGFSGIYTRYPSLTMPNLDLVWESSDMLVAPLLDSVTDESDAVSSLLLSLSSVTSSLEESLLESFVTLSSESSVEDSSVVVVVFLRITFFFCFCLLS